MARSKLPGHGARRIIDLSTRLYSLFLQVYPADFRRVYGTRMLRVFRDSCRDALRQHGATALVPFWLQTLSDLFLSACQERWSVIKEGIHAMTTFTGRRDAPARLWFALVATIIAFIIALIASLNLYLIEDASHLTQAAYQTSPLLRFSYDAIYLSTLAAGVAVCAIIGYTLVQRTVLVVGGLVVVALLVALGGFGGLLARQAPTFLLLFVIFLALTLIGLTVGRWVMARTERRFGSRSAGMLGACVGVCSLLLINVAALILHTLLLNPVSHELYMQGQIAGTHLNFSLIAMGLAFLTVIACTVSLGRAFRLPVHQPDRGL